MAQFDVHRNGGKQRDTIPFVVIVQSGLFDGYRRRVVIPLVRKVEINQIPNLRLNPTFKVKNVAVVLHPLEIVSVANETWPSRLDRSPRRATRSLLRWMS